MDQLRTTIQTTVHPSIWKAYQIGLVIGMLLLTTLSFFPGRRQRDIDNATSTRTTQQVNYSEKAELNSNSNKSESSGTQLYAQHRQSLQSMTNTTKRQSKETNNGYNKYYWTPHWRLNTGVYCIILAVTAYLLTQTYSGDSPESHPTTLLRILFRKYFPREAAVLTGKRQEP